MSWRTGLGVVLLVAAIVSGWSAWHMRERSEPAADTGQRSDYVLRDFELVMLGKDGVESVRLRAPELQRSREDESLAIVQPLFLMPGEDGGWQLASDRGWVDAEGSVAKLDGNVKGDSAPGNPTPTTFRTDRLELLPDQHLARTDDRVTLTQPGIMQTGVGFQANLQTRQYQFLSQVKTRYEPSPRR
ncbi:LPS export ABC transporter periplasmic protein LptC [Pseudoxanthomonas daejeonensis]|uniref:Lipopolysaccharide export system protein LptC n=1 Tax=Pseudoxanthomonas daejeonensis TaxID=266062 RepID=A0ABQ6Z5P0_9GAMM|nr:LPS export ABC transporter periplasmic protein LptC [Pseudoxanthomonas daejeonensis]KAF1693791.1 LPS export ABC transporter periplasmic protein LptC [Pseudoxanthomonas daejeonensis]UNK56876.1 LPS export ABC transporter periplasmic protein LptC [Pseudoxanthomonas daejeonensis]